jgi:hypothetical protein
LCCSLSGLAIGRLGKSNMGEMNCEKGEIVVSFIWQHHVPFTIFHHYETKLLLLNPTKTQFATNVLMVKRFFKLRPAIEQTIIDNNWTTFVNSLRGNHCQKLFTKVQTVRANIRMDEFWDTCANFVHMVELVLMSLRAFDGKQPCMGNVWFIMKTLERHVLSSWDPSFELPSNLVDVVEDQFY